MKKKHKSKRKTIAELTRLRALEKPIEEKEWVRPVLKVVDVFQQYNSELHSDYVFVPIPRVSAVEQLEKYSLEMQFYRIRKYALEKNMKLYPIDYRIQCSSLWRGESKERLQKRFRKFPSRCLNPKLYKPHYNCLKEIVHNLWVLMQENPSVKYALLFQSVDRAIRSDDYSKYNKDAPLIEAELKVYLEVTRPFFGKKPIPSIVICNPLMTAKKIDSWCKMYGDDFIPEKQTRQPGNLKREYDESHARVIELELEDEKTHREIADETGIPYSRVCSWWRKDPQYFPKS